MKVIDKFTTLSEIENTEQVNLVLEGLVSDQLSVESLTAYLNSVNLYSMFVGNLCIGFYSAEDCTDSVEVHAYIFPTCRKHSLSALRHITRSQTKPIKTSVYGTHLHVFKFLQRLGFIHTGTHSQVLTKNGIKYDVWDLLYKES